jgi:hypothetical protein
MIGIYCVGRFKSTYQRTAANAIPPKTIVYLFVCPTYDDMGNCNFIIIKQATNLCHIKEKKAKPSWSYGSWIYNYLCNQCLSPLMLWVRISIRAMCTTLCDKVCQRLATGRWFSAGPPVSSTNKTDGHDITEILLKVALNTIKPNQTNQGAKQIDRNYCMFWQKIKTSYLGFKKKMIRH